MTDTRTLYLIDGSGYIFRAFHALPMLTRPDGVPVNAVLGFTNMMTKLIADVGAGRLLVVFDAGRHSFRSEIYPEYKAHRPDPPPELIPQFALIREATAAFNLPMVELPGFEADDLIASYAVAARQRGDKVVIVSSDKDLMQLIADGITMHDPMKNRAIGPDEVREKFGVGPEQVVDVQALCGDSVDNVPGVRGIGVKTAAELINTYGSLEGLLSRLDEIRQPKRRETLQANAELARISRQLVELKRDVPLPVPLDDLGKRAVDDGVLRGFLTTNNFRSTMTRLEQTGLLSKGGAAPVAKPAPTAAPAATPPAEQNYVLIQDLPTLQDWVAKATTQGLVAVDTETTGLDAMTAGLVGISLALAPGEACYIPLAHVAPGQMAGGLDLGGESPPLQIPINDALKALTPLLTDDSVLKVLHNAKYDLHIFANHGIAVAPVDDTMLLSYVLDGARNGHGMDELADLHLGHTTIKYEAVAGKGKDHIGFARVALDKALAYAAEDADITLRLHRHFKPRLLSERMVSVYEDLDRPLVPVLVAMEREGIKVDRAELNRLSADFAARLAVLETEIHGLAGESFNVASPKQLGVVLFDKMGLPGGKKGKNGDFSTASDVLEPLAEAGHALPAKVLEYRQIAKLKSTYADALVEQINPTTGRVHTSFSQAITTTGRLSSNDPNLQNIPVRNAEGRKIRAAFVAEPGWSLLSVDYSQVELRILAQIADVPALTQAFRDGIDIHALTASEVFGVPLEGLDKETRRKAKAINFGIIYGISPFGLANNIGCSQGEARAFIEAYFARYPGIRAFMEQAKSFAREHGYVRTLFGRRCWMPGIADRNGAKRAFAERQAINAPIQGTAADLMKRAMIRLPSALRDADLKARMLLQVHDELLFEVPDAEIDATAALVRRIMEEAGGDKFSLPLIAEAGHGRSWAEAH